MPTPPPMNEAFKPIAVRAPSDNRLLFAVRCMLDLQLLTIHQFLRPRLAALRGQVLDVGAGEAPWQELVTQASYTALDVESADTFGMARRPGVRYYDGKRIPFDDASFEHVMSVEVLEHVEDAEAFMQELARVLRPGGTLVLTIPWSARLHHLPHDYRRYTRHGLRALVRRCGFDTPEIVERGNDVAVVANKLIVILMRLLRPRRTVDILWTWPLGLAVAPMATVLLVAAHVSMWLGLGSSADPLGYGLVARRC